MINREISDSKKFASLSSDAAVLFCLIIPHLNSHGKLNGGAGFIKDAVCPLISYLTPKKIEKLLIEISKKTNIKWFEHEGRYWIHAIKFLSDHQTLPPDRLGIDELPSYSGVTQVLVVAQVEVKDEVKDKGNTLSGFAQPISWKYLAGLIDGEANVRLNKTDSETSVRGWHIQPRITIYNTSKELLEKVCSDLSMGKIITREREKKNHKDLHEINFSSEEIRIIIKNCLEFSVVKKQQFLMLKDFLDHWPQDAEYCLTLLEKTKNLNSTGKERPDLEAPILYLNQKIQGKFSIKAEFTRRLIKARYAEGRTIEDFKNVIDRKVSEWLTNEKMAQYLRPSTLFNATNFENYLNQISPAEKTGIEAFMTKGDKKQSTGNYKNR